LYVIILCLFNI